MQTLTDKPHSQAPIRFRSAFAVALLTTLVSLLDNQNCQADSATWNVNPMSGDWNTAANWTPNTIPNSPSDTATFDVSNQTAVSLSSRTEVNGVVFNPGAGAFTIIANPTVYLTFRGVGITNNSGILQHFVTEVGDANDFSTMFFTNSATAGNLTSFTNNGANGFSAAGEIDFFNTSSAGSGTFINDGGMHGFFGGAVLFWDAATADHGIFLNEGGADQGSFGGVTDFFDNATAADGTFVIDGGPATLTQGGGEMNFQGSSTAANGTFIVNGGANADENGGHLQFADTSTADNARITINGGSGGGTGGLLAFFGDCSGGAARVELLGNGDLDISLRNKPGLTIGSVEGSGVIFLGANNLSIGSNDLDTSFSGLIQDGGIVGGTGGSLTKIGTGTLMLSGANSYTGGTIVGAGGLVINNTTGSGTGTDAVKVDSGTLAGRGTIAGTVTIGTGSGTGTFLAPGMGASKATTLTIQSLLTFKADSTCICRLNTKKTKADQAVANGLTIESGAEFEFKVTGNERLRFGKSATVISNTSATPISGTFANLSDGSTITVGSNTFQASYEGGDGNDLTLTVVP